MVKVATDMFQGDMKEVTGQRAQLSDAKTAAIRVVQLDREPSLARKLSAKGFPVDSLKRYKEAFCIRPVDDKQVWVVGSDARGTAYGVLELSRLAGVSPWTWWGDVYPERKSRLTLPTDYRTFQHPSVEYRGIFLNDEDWTLRPGATPTSTKHDSVSSGRIPIRRCSNCCSASAPMPSGPLCTRARSASFRRRAPKL